MNSSECFGGTGFKALGVPGLEWREGGYAKGLGITLLLTTALLSLTSG